MQFSTDTASRVIVGADVIATGSDMGQITPMLEQVHGRHGVWPAEALADGGFAALADIEAAQAAPRGATVYVPVPKPKDPKRDRHEPLPGDGAAVAAWRARMKTDEAKAVYKERASVAECVNAQARNRGLLRLLVRGLRKVRAVVLWYALAHNVRRCFSLRGLLAAAG